MATISFYLASGRKSIDGKSPLTLRFVHNKRRNFTTIGINLTPEEWDRKKQRVTMRHASYRSINLWLAEIETLARRAIIENVLPIMHRLTFERMCEIIRRKALHRTTCDQNFLNFFRQIYRCP